MVHTVFIVLHYKYDNITYNCIQSLFKLNKIEECKILVFDNGSNNGSYEKLDQRYSNNSQVILYKSDINLGFSEGNNQAYSIARSYSPRFVITLNNDVVIRQSDFLIRVEQLYMKDDFYVLGPDVFAPIQKEHQSPLYPIFPSLQRLAEKKQSYIYILGHLDEVIKKEKMNRRKSIVRRYIPMCFMEFFRRMKGKLGNSSNTEFENYKKNYQNCVLHGCCLIFSERYIRDNNKLFEPDTHFYHEELLLTLKCQTLGYLIAYNPTIQVIHYHELSTRKNADSIKDYIIMHSQNMLRAFEVLDEALRDNPWQKNH